VLNPKKEVLCMDVLTDKELFDACIRTGSPIIEGIPRAKEKDLDEKYWFSKESPIQASSIDLHFGKIFLPGKKAQEPGAEKNPLTGWTLASGRTAVVVTQEKFKLPKYITGIGFPPSTNMSFKGVLMTNPGHIDPGYVGHLRFTLINMGKEDYPLKQGDVVVSVLLFKLSQGVTSDWLVRHNGNVAEPSIQKYLDTLSSDFMDFENHASEIAKKTVKDAEITIKWGTIIVTIITALIGAYIYFLGGPVVELKKEVAGLKASLDIVNVKTRLDKVESRLKGTGQSPRYDTKGRATQKQKTFGKDLSVDTEPKK
jgi:deoxycytidine triphosphate deaminase